MRAHPIFLLRAFATGQSLAKRPFQEITPLQTFLAMTAVEGHFRQNENYCTRRGEA
jgi:hypothetical protein